MKGRTIGATPANWIEPSYSNWFYRHPYRFAYHNRWAIWLLLVVPGLMLSSGCDTQSQLIEARILQFGTVIDVSLIHHDLDVAEKTLTEIERQLAVYHHQWHAWENGDLRNFNQSLASQQITQVPPTLLRLINLSQYYYPRSNQLFNPALGKLIGAYGFHGETEPDQETIDEIKKNLPTMLDLELEPESLIATSQNQHLELDFGGIAKGYAIGLIAQFLQQQGYENYLINAGGDLVTSGTKFGKAWHIAIQNPFKPGAIASIELSGKHSLFTSGNYQRFYQKESQRVHHIIDPRTGNPSSNISSATVLTSNPVLADVAATTLMIDGLENSRLLASSLEIEDFLVIGENQHIRISASLAGKLEMIGDLPWEIID
jgi:thiamine biosynthesis lipoprotein